MTRFPIIDSIPLILIKETSLKSKVLIGKQSPTPAPVMIRPRSKIGKFLAKYIIIQPTTIPDWPMIKVGFRPIISAILPPISNRIIKEMITELTVRIFSNTY